MDVTDYPELPQRARIVKIAAQLFAQRGYHAVGMSDIQDAVKLGRGALYHHIRSKEDLLYDVTREYITELADSAGGERHRVWHTLVRFTERKWALGAIAVSAGLAALGFAAEDVEAVHRVAGGRGWQAGLVRHRPLRTPGSARSGCAGS